MDTLSPAPASGVNYDQAAASYARHRGVHPGVVQELIAGAPIARDTRILDVGCGTGNYARALSLETGCRICGIEPSAEMRERARVSAPWEDLVPGMAEELPFPDRSFDLVMTTDVIHHVGARPDFFGEAARVLRPGGAIATATDSHEDIARRRPLSSHFPETVAIELGRYPTISRLMAEMATAGFTNIRVVEVARDYGLTDIQAYRDRAFSSLLLIDEEAHRRGIARLEDDLARGPIPCISLYSIVWGSLPRA
jgi:SAM-dependent methyltransferase